MGNSEWAALLAMCTAVSFSPGPNTTLSTALAANHGLRRALRFCLAVPVGWALLLVLCGAGLGLLITDNPPLRWAIQWSGAAYMLWLAFKLSRTKRLGTADESRLNLGFWQGVGLQFLNIKAWMLALSLVAGWVAGKEDALERCAVLLPLMMLFGFISNLTYAAMGSLLREWLLKGARLLIFNRCMSLALVLTAGWMFTTSF